MVQTRWHVPRTRLLSLAVAAALLLPSSCRTARPVRSNVPVSIEEWTGEGLVGRRFTTEHFDIISTLLDAPFEAALPGFLEAAYDRYVNTIPPPVDGDGRLTTFVFGSRNEWKQFARRRFRSRYDVYARIRAGGFAEGDTSVSFYTSRSGTLATLAHEGWHQYLGARYGTTIPAWLNEGFACYHEAVDFAGSVPRFTPRHNTFRINSLREAIQQDRLLSLRQIAATDAGEVITQNHAGVAQTYYAQAWALITFLRHGADRSLADGLQRMLDDIADGTFLVRVGAARLTEGGGTSESLGEATFRAYFGCGPDDLADAYHKHLLEIAGF